MLKTLGLIPLYILRRWGIHLFVLGMSVFLLLLVHRKVYEHFDSDSRYMLDINAFKVANNPDWLIDQELRDAMNDSLILKVKTSSFDEDIINRLRQHYESNPWVKRVETIERRLPNDLKIKLELRRPYLAVAKNNKQVAYYLVDKDMVRLPGEYSELPAMPTVLPVVAGVAANPPLAGRIWSDKGLNAAVSVAAILDENNLLDTLKTKTIDVANIGGKINSKESEIVLVTQDKIRIEWGRPPDTDKFGELSVAEKINNIKTVLSACPQLKGVRYVKIQFDQPYIALEDK
ncbi:MAG: FtsQ-type POTRA domain-containing protein [Planctomycetes bacterium]|nr:FtsQ-type POTRA domain-containing protein [Planctomycetota bacterium]